MLNIWWLWMLVGLVLAALELAVPGYLFLGFAMGAFLTAGLIALNLGAGHTAITLLIFAALSGLCWAGLRRLFGSPRRDVQVIRHDINEN